MSRAPDYTISRCLDAAKFVTFANGALRKHLGSVYRELSQRLEVTRYPSVLPWMLSIQWHMANQVLRKCDDNRREGKHEALRDAANKGLSRPQVRISLLLVSALRPRRALFPRWPNAWRNRRLREAGLDYQTGLVEQHGSRKKGAIAFGDWLRGACRPTWITCPVAFWRRGRNFQCLCRSSVTVWRFKYPWSPLAASSPSSPIHLCRHWTLASARNSPTATGCSYLQRHCETESDTEIRAEIHLDTVAEAQRHGIRFANLHPRPAHRRAHLPLHLDALCPLRGAPASLPPAVSAPRLCFRGVGKGQI